MTFFVVEFLRIFVGGVDFLSDFNNEGIKSTQICKAMLETSKSGHKVTQSLGVEQNFAPWQK